MGIPYETLFRRANSSQIQYQSKTVEKFFNVEQKGAYTLRFTFINVNSKFYQAVTLFFNDFKGKVFINGENIKIPKKHLVKFNFGSRQHQSNLTLKLN